MRVRVFEKAHARMKRVLTESIQKIAGKTSRKELAGLVFQVAFGLLLAFYNQEKPIQSVDAFVIV